MRKTPTICCADAYSRNQFGSRFHYPTLPSAGSTPNKHKYPLDDIKEPTPCTLMYVTSRISRTIEVAGATVIPSHILHGCPIPIECAVVKVTVIREGHEFKDLDSPNEEEGIEKLIDAKGNFIL
jgi:hypothetical protein